MNKFLKIFLVLISGELFAADRILFIGDSQSYGSFGDELDLLFRTHPNFKIESYARGGATPDWYTLGLEQTEDWGAIDRNLNGHIRKDSRARTPKLAELIERLKPDHLIVQLSGNFLRMRDSSDEKIKSILKDFFQVYRSKSPHSRCTWVGTFNGRRPNLERFSEVLSLISEFSSQNKCEFIDSRNLVSYTEAAGDGIHLDTMGYEGVKKAREWAWQVFKKIIP